MSSMWSDKTGPIAKSASKIELLTLTLCLRPNFTLALLMAKNPTGDMLFKPPFCSSSEKQLTTVLHLSSLSEMTPNEEDIN